MMDNSVEIEQEEDIKFTIRQEDLWENKTKNSFFFEVWTVWKLDEKRSKVW